MAIDANELVFRFSLNTTTDAARVPSCGGAPDISGAPISAGGVLNELFDRVTSSQALAGSVEYRLVYVRNDNVAEVLFNAIARIVSDSSNPTTTLLWALDPAGVNGDSSITLLDEVDTTNLLSGLTFNTLAKDVGTGAGNDLPANGYHGIWLQRTVTAGTGSDAGDTAILRLEGETV